MSLAEKGHLQPIEADHPLFALGCLIGLACMSMIVKMNSDCLHKEEANPD